MRSSRQERWDLSAFAVHQRNQLPWFVNLSLLRGGLHGKTWHATKADLSHVNCTGSVRPLQRQLAANPIVRSAVTADSSVSAPTLESQLHLVGQGPTCRSKIYRTKNVVINELLSEDMQSIELLPSFLESLRLNNPGIFTELQREDAGHFVRAIIVLDPGWFSSGTRLFGVDAAHMKHNKYNGVQVVMVARDGDFRNRVAAVGLVPAEDHDSYYWFFERVLSHGFPSRDIPVFTDRHTGIISAASQLHILIMHCTRHMIGNMRADEHIKLAVRHEKFVWEAQAATTSSDFNKAIEKLTNVNAAAGSYLRELVAAKWALHPHYHTTPLYGWRTTNFVESEQAQALRLKPRLMLPYELFYTYASILMGETYMRQKLVKQWRLEKRLLTPKAERKFQLQLKEKAYYSVAFSTDTLVYVSRTSHPGKRKEVNLDGPKCPCPTWVQNGIVYRHILAALDATSGLNEAQQLMAACYQVANFGRHQRAIILPVDRELIRDTCLHPTIYRKQAGRPRKRRIRSRGEHGRVRKIYKCSNCGATDGHNRKTCRIIA